MPSGPMRWKKAIDAIGLIASMKPGISQYHLGKILFFADRDFLIQYGRTITGDRYVAMEHGPVPIFVRQMLKVRSSLPYNVIAALQERVVVERTSRRERLFLRASVAFAELSLHEKACLEATVDLYGAMGFRELRRLSQADPAFIAAWELGGHSNAMDLEPRHRAQKAR